MRRRAPFSLALVSSLALSAAPHSVDGGGSGRVDHVVLISYDGLRPDFYLDERWPAPMLQQMRRQGGHAAAVTSVFPSVTYPAHTTILTGVLPAEHGISYNSPFEPNGQTGRWYWNEESITAPTLWDAARRAGETTASVFWPVSVGAPVDYNLPEIWPLGEEDEDFVDPIRRAATPPGLLEELEREATGRLGSHNFSFGRLALDDKTAEIAAHLLATYRPALLTVHLIGADNFQHEEGRDGSMVRRAVAALDRGIARIVEAAEEAGMLDRTTFLVTGDHGFIELHTELAPNVWLVEAGLMTAAPDRGNWRATVHTAGAAGFLHLARSEDAEALERARQAFASQPDEVRALFHLIEREELDRWQTAPAAALGLAPAEGINISARHQEPALLPKGGASHGFLPDMPGMQTGFVAWGAGIRAGSSVSQMSLQQIAPLVSHLLGLEMPTARAPIPAELLAVPAATSTPP